jgi:DnaK suppressor protein
MLPAMPVEEKINARGSDMTGTATATKKAGAIPVREGEEKWTAKELTAVKSRLAAEIEEFEAEISAARTQAAEGSDAGEGAGDDQADAGAKTYEREHELALQNNSRDLMEQNERAIARIDAGTYGVCENCGKAIGKARLQAFPRATMCVPCKSKEERR